jgi:hypothetical protein
MQQVVDRVPQVTGLTDIEQAMATLKQPLDPNLIKSRYGFKDRQGNVVYLDYIEWFTAADILDTVDSGWSHEVKDIREMVGCIVVTVAVTVAGVTREGVGCSQITQNPEMDIKGAEHDALKRAAVKFGIGRELYHKEGDTNGGQSNGNGGNGNANTATGQQRQFPQTTLATVGNPRATNAGDLVTAAQLGLIRHKAQTVGVDAETECQSVLGCIPGDLSKKGASAFIDHLDNLTPRTFANQQPGETHVEYDRNFQPPPDQSAPSQGGQGNYQQPYNNTRPLTGDATEGQKRAIFAITKQMGISPDDLAMQQFGIPEAQLSKQQASDLIDGYGSNKR